jgi:hypothetical protein
MGEIRNTKHSAKKPPRKTEAKVNSSVKGDMFHITVHKTPYMFRPAVAIIRVLQHYGEILYMCVIHMYYIRICSPLQLKINYVRALK